MPGYYRAILTLSKDGAPSSQVMTDAWQCVQDWATDTYGNHDTPVDRPSPSSEMRLCNLVHRYTDASSCNWRVSVRLATDGNAVETDIELRATDSDDADQSLNPMARPPSVIRTLIERFDCKVGPHRLALNATRINAEDADSFVKNEIFNQGRLLPLLVVTDHQDGRSVKNMDADEMQQELAGLARVFAYDHATAWNVLRDLPQSLWCYDGAVRLFAPGCSADDLAQQHPFWPPWHLERVIQNNRLWQMLRDECLLRITHQRSGRLFSRVENALNAEDMKNLQDSMSNLQNNPIIAGQVLNLLDKSAIGEGYVRLGLYKIAISVGRAMKNRADKFELLLNQLGAAPSDSEADPEPAPEPTPPRLSFSTIHACAKHADATLPYLRFLPNALDTAQSRYTQQYDKHANRIYTTFEVLNECGRQRTQPGGLGKNVELWLKENRVEYSDESESTMREYHQERTFFDPDKDDYIPMPHHIKLLGNDIRIHLTWDGEENKWLIGYIGRHLRTSESPN